MSGQTAGPWYPAMHRSPRCGARTRAHAACRSPAVRGRARCRMHGGAAGSGARRGNCNALKHGAYTAAAREKRQQVWALLRRASAALAEMEDTAEGGATPIRHPPSIHNMDAAPSLALHFPLAEHRRREQGAGGQGKHHDAIHTGCR